MDFVRNTNCWELTKSSPYRTVTKHSVSELFDEEEPKIPLMICDDFFEEFPT